MITLNQDNLLKYLRQKQYKAELQPETQQIYFIFHIEGHQFPLFAKIDEQQMVLQLLMFFPCTFTPSTVSDTARLLHLLNKEIDLPGFGLDETSKVIFFRSVLPTLDGEINELLIDKFLMAIPQIGRACLGVVVAVASGTRRFEAVTDQIHNVLKQFGGDK